MRHESADGSDHQRVVGEPERCTRACHRLGARRRHDHGSDSVGNHVDGGYTVAEKRAERSARRFRAGDDSRGARQQPRVARALNTREIVDRVVDGDDHRRLPRPRRGDRAVEAVSEEMGVDDVDRVAPQLHRESYQPERVELGDATGDHAHVRARPQELFVEHASAARVDAMPKAIGASGGGEGAYDLLSAAELQAVDEVADGGCGHGVPRCGRSAPRARSRTRQRT